MNIPGKIVGIAQHSSADAPTEVRTWVRGRAPTIGSLARAVRSSHLSTRVK